MHKRITSRRFAVACVVVCFGLAGWWALGSTADERSLYGYWRAHNRDGDATHDVHLRSRGRLGVRTTAAFEHIETFWQAKGGRIWTRDRARLTDWWQSLRSFELPNFRNQYVGHFELVSPDEFHFWDDGEKPDSYFRFVRITETTPPLAVVDEAEAAPDESPVDAAPSTAPVQESP